MHFFPPCFFLSPPDSLVWGSCPTSCPAPVLHTLPLRPASGPHGTASIGPTKLEPQEKWNFASAWLSIRVGVCFSQTRQTYLCRSLCSTGRWRCWAQQAPSPQGWCTTDTPILTSLRRTLRVTSQMSAQRETVHHMIYCSVRSLFQVGYRIMQLMSQLLTCPEHVFGLTLTWWLTQR